MSLKECVCCHSNPRTESEIPALSLPSNSFHFPLPHHDQISTQSHCQGLLSSLSPLLKSLTFHGSLIDSEKDTSWQMSSWLGYGCGCKPTHLFRTHTAEVRVPKTAAGYLLSSRPWKLSTHTTKRLRVPVGRLLNGSWACVTWLPSADEALCLVWISDFWKEISLGRW